MVKSSSATKPRSRSAARPARKPAVKQLSTTRWALLLGLFLVIATVAVYYPVHAHPFANFDDGPYYYANQHVLAGLSRDTVKWAFTLFGAVTPDVPDWHPLAWISHAADAQMFGPDDPAGPHEINLLLHVLNVRRARSGCCSEQPGWLAAVPWWRGCLRCTLSTSSR